MNIAFFHINGIMPELGGISRITYNLTNEFRLNSIDVYLIAHKNTDKKFLYDEKQIFLPVEENITADENIEYMTNFIKEKEISVIINQAPLFESTVKLLSEVKKRSEIKIVSCIHNCILTPIDNYAYIKEYALRKKNLSILFHILNYSLIKKIIKYKYKKKHQRKYQEIARHSDYIVNIVPEIAREYEEISNIKLDNKGIIIPNCIPIKQTENTTKKKHIIWVGTTDISIKRVDNMIKIWNEIHRDLYDWKLQILGDGPSLEEAKKLSKEFNLERISFEGRVNPDPYYQEASIIVITSSHESFSLVTVEAMSYGVVPIINNSFPAGKMLTENGKHGILVRPFNNKAMADTIIQLCSNPAEIKHRSQLCYNYSRMFNSNNIYKQWKDLLFDKIDNE